MTASFRVQRCTCGDAACTTVFLMVEGTDAPRITLAFSAPQAIGLADLLVTTAEAAMGQPSSKGSDACH